MLRLFSQKNNKTTTRDDEEKFGDTARTGSNK
jgi:hypothetical protein